MPHSKLQSGEIVLREWGRQTGVSESVLPFSTLDELFTLCLSVAAPEMLDRIVLRGMDQAHAPRTVTFEFQSITISSQRTGE